MNRIILGFIITLFLFGSCARRGNINGGSKDTIPPVLLKARPRIQSTNFNQKKIKIYFDEYVKIKDLRKNLIISPPQENNPVITPLGTASKMITIKIRDTLKPNTTYSFNFGNSIVDNNEGNKMGNFKYVFSTGDYIDSLSISGVVSDYNSKGKVKNIDVALYKYNEYFTDSTIYKQRPDYISNTLDSTLFDITNVKEGKYLLIALEDKNNNKKYDPKSDKIAFIKDTIILPTDQKYALSLFKEIPAFQILIPREMTKGHLILPYLGDSEGVEVKLATEMPDSIHRKFIFEKQKDSIHFWYTPYDVDSLNFVVTKGDYKKELTAILRTSKEDSLNIQAKYSGKLHLLDTFALVSKTPIYKLDAEMIKVLEADSIEVSFTSFLSKDSTQLYVNLKKKPKTAYKFQAYPNAITDVFGEVNDTLSYKFNVGHPDDYVSIVKFTPKGKKKIPLIIELLKNKKMVKRAYTKTDESVEFTMLTPGKYKIRVVLDENGNHQWDTGSFLERRQAEVIKNYPTELKFQAGWEYLDNILNID